MKKIFVAVLLAACSIGCLTPLPPVTVLPEVQLPVATQQDATWKSTDYDQKPILMVFMGSWCPYCKMTIPAVNIIAEEYGDRVEVISVFIDREAEPVQKAIKEHDLKARALYNGGELAEVMEVQGLPHSVLFDKKHQAIKHWEGFDPNRADHFREELNRILK